MGDRRFYVSVLVVLAAVTLPCPHASADLLGIDPGFPVLVFDNPGGTSYDSTTNEYAIVADAISIQFTPETPPRPVLPTDPDGQRFVRLRILVDNDGMLIGGPIGPDLLIVGAVDADGDGTIDFEGTLLTGEILGFGFVDGPGSGEPSRAMSITGGTDEFDFRLRLTGGAIAALYGASDIGVVNTSAMSTFEDFTVDFFGDANGSIGPIAPRGACCLPDGSCTDDVLQDECEAGGGFFGGRDSLCSTTECPGACCLPDESCVLATRTKCASNGGDFRGEGTTCDDVSCASAGGACCFDDGSCLVRTQDECRDEGGAYQGSGTTCSPGLCPPPEGACCFPNGACFVLTQADCGDQGGLFQGRDVACIPKLCPPPKGACCRNDGTCFVAVEEECLDAGGLYQGDDSVCEPGLCDLPTGACCYDDGSCLVTRQAECHETGGVYQGSGSECLPELCPDPQGACCLVKGVCVILTRDACEEAGADYRGDGTDCDTTICAETGACCLTGGECRLVIESECDALGGDFRGDGVECTPTTCSEGACCLDDGSCTFGPPADCDDSGGEYQGDGVPCTPGTLGEPGRYRLGNHPDANQAPPAYGLRLDELFNVTGETDVFTFDFNGPAAEMLLDYDGTSIRIHGTAFGGLDDGDDYDPNWISLVEIDFTYDIVETAAGDDDLIVTTPSGTNSGTITWLATGEVITLEDKSSGEFTFRFGDEDDDAGHREFPGNSGWGWLQYADGRRDGTQDWIFTARGLCDQPATDSGAGEGEGEGADPDADADPDAGADAGEGADPDAGRSRGRGRGQGRGSGRGTESRARDAACGTRAKDFQ